MMNFINIGDIVNTHGLKGEIKILSDFKYKDIIFKVGNKFYIGDEQEPVIIKSYRVHKNFDMFTLDGFNDINDVIIYKGESIYINRDEYDFPGILDEDLVGLDVYDVDRKIGIVEAIMKTDAHGIIVVKSETTKHLIPYISEFIENIDLDKNSIKIKVIEGLLNEN